MAPMLYGALACSSATAPKAANCDKQIADAKAYHGPYVQHGPTTQNGVTVETLFFEQYSMLAIFKWGDGISACQETWETQ